jgi:hypothetical protein
MPDRGRDGAAAGSHSPPAPLTPREVEIITRIALGATSRAATGRRDARVGTFAWTRSTGELRSCASSPSLLDLDADDDRPLLTRIVAHLQRDDIDRPRRRARRAISRRRGVGRCPLDDPRRGGSSPPGDGDACTRTGGRHRDRRGDRLTGMRHIEHALEVRQAVTAALAEWHVVGSMGSSVGSARRSLPMPSRCGRRGMPTCARSLRGSRATRRRPSRLRMQVTLWSTAPRPGLAVVGCAGGVDPRPVLNAGAGLRRELAFPILTLTGVLAVVVLRSASGSRSVTR